jgi:Sec-independent protein translocase protein TatA
LGSDLGGAIKGFKNSMASAEDEKKSEKVANEPQLLSSLENARVDTNAELQKTQSKVGG